jgi:hypothetical protein
MFAMRHGVFREESIGTDIVARRREKVTVKSRVVDAIIEQVRNRPGPGHTGTGRAVFTRDGALYLCSYTQEGGIRRPVEAYRLIRNANGFAELARVRIGVEETGMQEAGQAMAAATR